jgi:hypothetical protein
MKIALCTTTIHVPYALKLLRKCSEGVRFFVATDEKTPKRELGSMEIPNVLCMRGEMWKCSELIGWNTIARRNIAFLEALKWGADVIYSWDDDNIPTLPNHFVMFDGPNRFHGIRVRGAGIGGPDGWFDPGTLLIPRTRHRGYPHGKPQALVASSVTDAKIGVYAGLVIGDPDVDAVTRMEHRPDIGGVHLLGQAGVVVDLNTWTVFNSQNTAVIRELVPAWFMMPGVGRHDDIYASLIVQRVMRERNLHVHFGPPFTYQQRNDHNLIIDLRAEIDGMERVTDLAHLLDHILLPGKSVVDDTRRIYETLLDCEFLPRKSVEAGLVWLTDVETVL